MYKIERTSNEKSKDCAPGSCNKRKSEQPDDHLYKRLPLSLPVVPVQSSSHVNDNNQSIKSRDIDVLKFFQDNMDLI